jgi:hypothetical protein
MGKKLDKLAGLRSGMAAAAEWDKQLEWVRDTVISIEDKLSEAAGDFLPGHEIVGAGVRWAVSNALEDDWIREQAPADRLRLSQTLLNASLRGPQVWFEDRAARDLALAKELKRMQRRIPAIARRAPGGVRKDESLREAIERAAAAGDVEARVIAAWLRKGAGP